VKTIKQIADEIGVSKQAIYKRIKKEPLSTNLSTSLSTIDGRLTVSVDGENLIKQAFEQMSDNQSCQPVDSLVVESPTKVDGATTKVDSLVDEKIIDILQKNIEVLQSQLEIKDKQIDDLSSALVLSQQTAAAAQALHAGTMNHLSVINKKKPGVLSRIFGHSKES